MLDLDAETDIAPGKTVSIHIGQEDSIINRKRGRVERIFSLDAAEDGLTDQINPCTLWYYQPVG
jgi:hypothetical protein